MNIERKFSDPIDNDLILTIRFAFSFFGFKRLQNYLNMEADSVVITMHSDIVVFEEFLRDNKTYDGNMFDMLLAVLSEKVFSDECNMVSYQNDIVKLLTVNEIISRFRDKCLTLDESKFKYVYNIAAFMKKRMPVSAADALTGLVTFSIARFVMKTDPESVELLKLFQSLFDSFQLKRQIEEGEAKARQVAVRGRFTGKKSQINSLVNPSMFPPHIPSRLRLKEFR